MAAAPAALDAQLVADIEALTEDVWNYYVSNRSAEQYEADTKRGKEFLENEEVKAGVMAKFTEAFAASDANGDGRLDADEWKVFQGHMKTMTEERGDFFDAREDVHAKWYALGNRVSSEAEGLAMGDFFQVMGASMKKSLALKAAHDAK